MVKESKIDNKKDQKDEKLVKKNVKSSGRYQKSSGEAEVEKLEIVMPFSQWESLSSVCVELESLDIFKKSGKSPTTWVGIVP